MNLLAGFGPIIALWGIYIVFASLIVLRVDARKPAKAAFRWGSAAFVFGLLLVLVFGRDLLLLVMFAVSVFCL